MKKYSVLILLLLLIQGAYSQAPGYWAPEQIIKHKAVSSVRVSPDGKKVVYAVKELIVTEGRNEFINHLFLSDINSINSIQLTKGEKNNTNPKWSPDGKQIAFVSNRDGKNNLYLLPVSGGEAERLTDLKNGISDFKWNNKGNSIAFTMSDAASEEDGKNKKSGNDWYFMNEKFK